MKKLTFILLILLLATGCNPKQKDTSSEDVVTKGLQVYESTQYHFRFEFPEQMEFRTPSFSLLEDKMVEMGISQTEYPNTNFSEAVFSVSSAYVQSPADCFTLNAPENGDGFKTEKRINGVTYYMTESIGVGAGNIYESKVYRTLIKDMTCFELNQTIHTTNVGNYPEGTVTEVNKAEIQSRLDKILNTFKFTN
jgi:hypothetical protein